MTRPYWIIAGLLTAGSVGRWRPGSIPACPSAIPTHWNIEGKVDGYGDKSWTTFLMPGMMIAMLVLFYFLPALSPKHFEVDSFRSTYLYIMVLTTGLFAYMHGVILLSTVAGGARGSEVHGHRPRLHRGNLPVLRTAGQRDGQGAQELLHRHPRALDAGQRPGLERHAPPGRLGDGRGRRDRIPADDRWGIADRVAIGLLIGSMLIPMVYSFIHYKALERRGAL